MAKRKRSTLESVRKVLAKRPYKVHAAWVDRKCFVDFRTTVALYRAITGTRNHIVPLYTIAWKLTRRRLEKLAAKRGIDIHQVSATVEQQVRIHQKPLVSGE